MPRTTTTIPKATAAQILMNAGAKRVGMDAAAAFAEVLEAKATLISSRAVQLARHSGRKTIHEEDIKLSLQ